MTAQPAAPQDVVEQNRAFWREITEMDEGECGQMRMLRELCDECERLRASNATLLQALRRALVVIEAPSSDTFDADVAYIRKIAEEHE